MDRQSIAMLGDLPQRLDIGDIKAGIDSLREHVQGEGDDIDIAGPLAVAEQSALNAVCTGHHAKLSRSHAGAAIIVRVERQDSRVAVFYVAGEPFDLIGINVGRCHLDRGWEIEDQLVRGYGAKHFHDGFAYFLRVVEFCTREAFWRILEGDFALSSDILGEIAD